MKEISVKALSLNPFTAFGDDWMALSAGTEETGFNAMTVAWGNFGTLWERGSHANRLPTAVCYVRPSRYTKAFWIASHISHCLTLAAASNKRSGILAATPAGMGIKLCGPG